MPVSFSLRCLYIRLVGAWLMAVLVGAAPTLAQETSVKPGETGVHLTLGGMMQSRLSYGWRTILSETQDRVGFGLRRVRLKTTATVAQRAGVFIQIDGASGSVRVLDAWAFYQSGPVRVRVGRIVSAQPRAITLTSSARLDAIDRAAIAERWAAGTIGGDGRDFGIDLHYVAEQGEVMLFFHNGDNDFGRGRSNFREGISGSDATGGTERSLSELAVSFYSALRPKALPGVEVGGFVGYNGSENPNTEAEGQGRAYVSYAGHLYWGARPGSQRLRLKADVIGTQYEELTGAGPAVRDQHAVGVAGLVAVGISGAAELFARVEQFDPNVNRTGRGDLFLTAGASLSLSALHGRPYHQARLTFGYSTRRPESDNAPVDHLATIQAQVAF